MSFKTWKAEFYPKPPNKRTTAVEATKHSLRKWEGALKKNLKKHSVRFEDGAVQDDDDFLAFDGSSCALCLRFYADLDSEPCMRCPLFKVVGYGCGCGEESDIYIDATEGNPKFMVAALRKALRLVQRKSVNRAD